MYVHIHVSRARSRSIREITESAKITRDLHLAAPRRERSEVKGHTFAPHVEESHCWERTAEGIADFTGVQS